MLKMIILWKFQLNLKVKKIKNNNGDKHGLIWIEHSISHNNKEK
jgi:hypothetical protein